MHQSWGTIEKVAKDRHNWRTFVAGLHANSIPGSKQASKQASKYEILNITTVGVLYLTK